MRPGKRVRRTPPTSAVDVFAVSKFKHKDGDPLVLDIANQSVIADTVAPQAPLFALQGFAPLPRVGSRFKPLSQKVKDRFLSGAVGVCDLFLGGCAAFH